MLRLYQIFMCIINIQHLWFMVENRLIQKLIIYQKQILFYIYNVKSTGNQLLPVLFTSIFSF